MTADDRTTPADTRLVDALQALLTQRSGAPVKRIETALSWLLLTRDEAWKLRRPVRLPYVDFSQPAARLHDAEEELRLNRRLAPSLYRRLVPLGGSPDEPRPDPDLVRDGPPFEHALLMRRFADGALLSERLAAGRLDAAVLLALADRLAAFHQAAPPAPEGADWGRAATVAASIDQVRQQLGARAAALGGPGAARERERLGAVDRWLGAELAALGPVIDARRAGGAVREGHGDLHLANAVVLDDGPPPEVTAFDCLEFDPALRWIDVIADVAFLSMDLQARGRRDLAHAFLDRWLETTGEFAGVRLLRLYSVYRALVRHLVGGLATPAPGTPDYLGCAQDLVAASGQARLLITCGLSGSGKSTLAARLLQAAGAIRLRSDVERKRLHGLTALASSGEHGLQLYDAESTRRTFEALRAGAAAALAAGYPVILDAAFVRRDERDRCRTLAASLGLPFTILHCRAAVSLLQARVAARAASGQDASEAGPAELARQLASHEPLAGDELRGAIEVDTGAEIDIEALARRWLSVDRG